MKPLYLPWKSILTAVTCVILTLSCEKEGTSLRGLPRTPEEIAESVKLSREIVTECSSIVEAAISKAYNQDALIDPQQIAKDIRRVDGVLSASPTSTGSAIVVQQEDSIYLNIQVVTGDDQRFFINSKNNASALKSSIPATSSDYIIPNGDGKALILAPFQSSFNTNLDSISELLHDAGYEVDIYLNKEATLDCFRGSFLNDYDVVYIKTHGSAEGITRINGVLSTVFATGEEYTEDLKNWPYEEQRDVAITYPVINGETKIHYGLTVPYLNLTCDLNFNNSWILASACESAMVDEESSSLSQAFLSLGAGGYNGYDRSIAVILANMAEVKMTYEFTSGRSFKEASRKVRLDPILVEISYILRMLYRDNPEFTQTCHINLFDDNQISEEPFYLKPPCVDADGNTYKTVKIGNQWWMAENLTYLPAVGPYDVQSTNNPIYYVYNYMGTNVNEAKMTDIYNTYGVLYNYAAAKQACPTGWHLPSDDDWNALEIFLGMPQEEAYYNGIRGTNHGGKLKEVGFTHWLSPNGGANNESGFTALPGGARYNGTPIAGQSYFGELNELAYFWTSTDETDIQNYIYGPWIRCIFSNFASVSRYPDYKENGFSVRCIKD